MTKIMIVDDDRTMVKLLQTLLELDGYEVSVAPRGADVLPKAKEVRPDIFLLDYHLSDMDGVEVVHALRQSADFANTPIIVASGLDVEDEVVGAGANKFITKPFEPDELPTLFKSLIEG